MKTRELLRTIQAALEADRNILLEDTPDTIKEWDSLGHLAILVSIDKKLGGRASKIKKLATCSSAKDFVVVLKKHGLLED